MHIDIIYECNGLPSRRSILGLGLCNSRYTTCVNDLCLSRQAFLGIVW